MANKELLSELGIDISPEKLDLACPDGYLKQLSDELKTSPEELAAILKVKAGKAIGGGSDRYSVLSQWKGSYRELIDILLKRNLEDAKVACQVLKKRSGQADGVIENTSSDEGWDLPPEED